MTSPALGLGVPKRKVAGISCDGWKCPMAGHDNGGGPRIGWTMLPDTPRVTYELSEQATKVKTEGSTTIDLCSTQVECCGFW